MVGGRYDNNGVGAAWVWTRSGTVWTQLGGKLVGTGGMGGTTVQGFSVALSADGNTAIVGGWIDTGGIGAAWVYIRTNGVWTQQGSKLVGTGAVGNAGQGLSVALSADGNTAIVGGRRDNSDTGAAWAFTRSGLRRLFLAGTIHIVGATPTITSPGALAELSPGSRLLEWAGSPGGGFDTSAGVIAD
jgi:hypothetical protein